MTCAGSINYMMMARLKSLLHLHRLKIHVNIGELIYLPPLSGKNKMAQLQAYGPRFATAMPGAGSHLVIRNEKLHRIEVHISSDNTIRPGFEDRIVKRAMVERSAKCTCPPGLPVCACGASPDITILTRKPVRPSAQEIRTNPRARSALLRVAEKVAS